MTNEVERNCGKEKWSGGGTNSNNKSDSYSLRFNLGRELKSKKDPGYKKQGSALWVEETPRMEVLKTGQQLVNKGKSSPMMTLGKEAGWKIWIIIYLWCKPVMAVKQMPVSLACIHNT